MIESEEEQGSRLILPPVAHPTRTHQHSIHQILSLLARKKEQYQGQIHRQEPTDQLYSLKYARCQTQSDRLDPADSKALVAEEFLARGSAIEQSINRKTPKKKSKLLVLQSNSTIHHLNNSQNAKEKLQQSRYCSLQPRKKGQSRGDSSKRQIINSSAIAEFSRFNVQPPEFLIQKYSEEVETKRKQKLTQQNPIKNQKNYEKDNIIENFKQCIQDLRRSSRTNQRLEKTIKNLETFNPFFRKIQRVVGVCLLRVGKIKTKSSGNLIYEMDEVYNHFYIILCGEVKISGRNGMHKLCESGETLLEETLFSTADGQKSSVSLQKARSINETWLLEVQRNDLLRLQKQLNRYGFRQGLNQLKTILKRNNIIKNWIRNKFKLIQKK